MEKQTTDYTDQIEAYLGTFLTFPRVMDALIAEAEKSPYFHLGSEANGLYMGRWWLHEYKEKGDMGARIHHIARPDSDRHLHDHPYPFVSVILRGGYTEAVPVTFEGVWQTDGMEEARILERTVTKNQILFRQANDRHKIVAVLPDTVTLFITGPKPEGHGWGYYTKDRVIPWREYLGENEAHA